LYLNDLSVVSGVPSYWRPLGVAAARWDGASEGLIRGLQLASRAGPSENPSRSLCPVETAAAGALCVFVKGKGPQGVGRRNDFNCSPKNERRNMLRRNLVGILVLALLGTAASGAQVKEMPRTPVKPINSKPSIVDINAAPEAEIVSIGIERAVAKKIVDGRPWRNKRDLLTKQVLTKEQYEKLKDSLVAKQPKKS
jgi:competence protein ComEA